MSPFYQGVLVGLFLGAIITVGVTCAFITGSWYFDASWEEESDFEPDPDGGEPVLIIETVGDMPSLRRVA